MKGGCQFCDYDGPSPIIEAWNWLYVGEVYAIEPLDPVTPGHLLVIPRRHVAHALEDPILTGEVFRTAAHLARSRGYVSANLITSAGEAATQTVPHLHVHVVPRSEGDGLRLPWAP